MSVPCESTAHSHDCSCHDCSYHHHHRLQSLFSSIFNSTYLGASTTAAATERKHSPGEGSLVVNPSGGHHGVRPPIGPAAATAAATLPPHADHGSSLKTGIHVSPLAWLHGVRAPRRPVLSGLGACCCLHRSSLSGML